MFCFYQLSDDLDHVHMFEIVVTEKISKSKLHLNRMVVQIDRIDDSSITPVFGEKHYGKYKIHEIKAH